MLFDAVLKVMQQMFQFFFNLMNSLELRSGVSLWSVFIVFLVGGGILKAVLSTIGGAGLASATSSSIHSMSYDSHKDKPKAES